MSVLASAPSCVASSPDASPEDTFVAIRMHDALNTTVIHCGGFSSSEITTERKIRSSITFHYIDAKWLRTFGAQVLRHVHF